MVQSESKCKHTHTVNLIIHPSRVTSKGYIAGSEEKVILCLDCEQVVPVKSIGELIKVTK